MAKKQNTPSSAGSQIETNTFSKGMQKDMYAGLVPKEQWGHARNAANNSVDGDIGIIGNEPANLECAEIPYTAIGAIHRYGDQWVIFSTDDVSSEIGLFDDSKCEYKTLVNDPCLNFNRKYLITGAAKENYDCTWQTYWDDGNNPSRSLNIDNVPYIQVVVSTPGADCVLYEDTTVLDCEKIRIAPLVEIPCVKLTKSVDGGQLRNGSYRAYIAYTLNEQTVTDYIGVSNIQALFAHDNNGGSLDIKVTNLDKKFDYYELVILSDNQGQKDARSIGLYSTEQSSITIDFIDPALTAIGVEFLFLRTPAYEKSESMYVVNDYLIRQGPTEQFDFNYQPLANKIKSSWVVAEYDANYYFKGGNETQFMRDEVYSFFIRWIYNTGETSSSYHIPGRPPSASSQNQFQQPMPGNLGSISGDLGTGPGISLSGSEYNFQIFNTAQASAPFGGPFTPTGNGGTIIQRGKMAYWQSTEEYSSINPEIWNSTYVDPVTGVNIGGTTNPNFDLCGKKIRHHKMPTEETHPSLALSSGSGSTIRILGVEFGDIERPKYNDGTYIENIVGYEILRGSREGAKSILAKGIFRNMRKYNIPDSDGNIGPKNGLYPNFPYNDLRDDVYHYDGSTINNNINFGGLATGTMANLFATDPLPRTDGCDDGGLGPETTSDSSLNRFPALKGYKKDIFTFHSPELMFRKPFLNPYEIRIYGAYSGVSEGHFIVSEKHPQNKLLRNAGALIAGILGTGYAINQLQGTQESNVKGAENSAAPFQPAWAVGPVPLGSNLLGYNAYSISGSIGQGLSVAASVASQVVMSELTKISDLFGLGGTASELAQSIEGGIQGAFGLTPGMVGGAYETKYIKDSDTTGLSFIFKSLLGFINSATQIAIGAQKVVDLLYNLISAEDFAYKHNSAGLFSKYHKTIQDIPFRSRNNLSNYIGSVFQNFNPNSTDPLNNALSDQFKINNLFRPDTVAIQSHIDLPIPTNFLAPVDKSRYVIGGDSEGNADKGWMLNPEGLQYKPISALYGALKFNFENQYGQLDGIKQVVMNDCLYKIDIKDPPERLHSTGPIFTGDTYVGRYTEKVIMPIFSDFLLGQPDQFPYNYLQRINIPYPRYWMDTRKYDTSKWADIVNNIGNSLFGGSLMEDLLPNDLYYLDRGENNCVTGLNSVLQNPNDGNSLFAMKVGAMYTHCNGVIDFFVESEINLANRDYDNTPEGRHYDNFRYQEYDEMFNAQIIKKDNNYKYDYSLSASRFLSNLVSSGNIQPRDYNPQIAETCFTYYPKRLIYSLQAQLEKKKDFWRVFLVNNYRDFKNPVNIIKPINKNGAIIFFPYQSPQMFQGVDTLETTDFKTKITIGDGGLFNQAFQNITNSDISNEYGSCESQRGVINTPYGFFFISQAQGKVFQQAGQSIKAISNSGMKWWFNKYLPSNLLRQFPELEFSELGDNPVIGVGCQITYDISDDILYVCKKDFELKDEWVGIIIYDEETDCFLRVPSTPNSIEDSRAQLTIGSSKTPINGFVDFPPILVDPHIPPVGSRNKVEIGDPLYFNDCSWTVSYDPKVEAWISFHDWHPELCLSSINHFLTTKTKISDVPQCPPGYVYNAVSRMCEKLTNQIEEAIVTVSELGSSYDPSNCIYDVVFSLDSSGSTGSPTNQNSIAYAEINFVTTFLNDPSVIAAMAANNLQVGFTTWSGTTGQKTMNPNGYSMSNTITTADVQLWYETEWIGSTTNVEAGFNHAIGILDNRASSQLGDRSSNPNFKSILIMVPDGGSTATTDYGCNYQSTLAGGTGLDFQYIYGIFASNSNIASINDLPTGISGDVLNQITCDNTNFQFSVSTQNAQFANDVTDIILENSCGSQVCECLPGYTLVYWNESEQNFTNATGDCLTDKFPPICRKVECNCPPGADPNSILIQTGECDDVYLSGSSGDLNYINFNPVQCRFNGLQSVPPSFMLGGIWRHNYRCDLFANYYDVDYPWEVELIENTGQNVFTIRSLEYQLESYVYKGDLFNGCSDDRWHDLDFNFDESIIYNTEQVSGLLKLNLDPIGNPLDGLTYPIINANDIDILYSKVEQKYRFNQFWDVTNDRGEFTNAEQQILITQCNGYIRDLNAANLDYNKVQGQRKKFRHYYNKVILRRSLSNNRKMLLKLNNSKLNLSFR